MHSTLLGYHTNSWDYTRAFCRNLGLVSKSEQARLSDLKIAIPGMGGVGGAHLITLLRSGVQNFHIADFDTFELENFNRQYGAFTDTLGKPKLDSLIAEGMRVNPEAKITTFNKGVIVENIDDFLNGVDVVVDGLDFFCIQIRRKLFAAAKQRGIHVVSAGPIGFGASMLCFAPDKGMSFDSYFDFSDSDSESELIYKFALGLTPRTTYLKYFRKDSGMSVEKKRGPSLALACQLCAGMAAAEAIKIYLGRGNVKFAPYYSRFDAYLNKYYQSYLLLGNRNPIQKFKIYFAKMTIGRAKSKDRVAPEVLPPKPSSNGLTPELLKYFAACGTLAASGDNSQHWKFSIGKDDIVLKEDKIRSQFHYSVNNLAQFLSYGAVAENISIAAGGHNYKCIINFLDSAAETGRICDINFAECDVSGDPLYKYLPFRHTNRNNYNGKKIDSRKQEAIKSQAESIDGISMHLFTDRAAKALIRKAAVKADKYIWQNPELHSDLFKWIRFDPDSKEGMDLGVLGLEFHEKLIFPYLKNWNILKLLNKAGFNNLIAIKTYIQMRSSPLYAVLTVGDNTLKSYFEAGRALSRLWICANSLGLSLQPMTSSVMLLHKFLYERHLNDSPVFEEIHNDYSRLFDIKRDLPVMLFRIGYAKEVKQTTGRRPVEDFIEIDN